MFTSAVSVDKLCQKVMSLQLTSLGQLGFVFVQKIGKVRTFSLKRYALQNLILGSLFDVLAPTCLRPFLNGWTGLFCPCILFGRNVERLREDTPWTTPCVCHAVCVEGGMALAAATAVFHGIDPRTSFLIFEGLLFAWWMCGIYTGLLRQTLQRKYHLKNSPCDPCLVHCCMHWCALCQEHREMKRRLDDDVTPMTVVNPPPLQEMNANRNSHDTATFPSQEKDGAATLEMQAL